MAKRTSCLLFVVVGVVPAAGQVDRSASCGNDHVPAAVQPARTTMDSRARSDRARRTASASARASEAVGEFEGRRANTRRERSDRASRRHAGATAR